MLLFGHIGFSYSIAMIIETFYKIFHQNNDVRDKLLQKENANTIIHYQLFMVTIFLPDIIDKTISQLTVHSGRAFGHTLLLVFLASIVTLILTKGNKQVSFSVFLGSFLHLILDLDNGGFVPFFWPFIPYIFPSSEPWTIQRLLMIYLTSPPISEIIGLALIMMIIILNWKNIIFYLRYQNPISRRVHEYRHLDLKLADK